MQNGNGKIVFDIDGTICTIDHSLDYSMALPKEEVIRKINGLHEKGVYIVLQTARGTETGIDWRSVTEKQLKVWGVKYDELLFGKPSADLYVDDKACNILDWNPTISHKKKIDKVWGTEYLLTVNEHYAMKRLEVDRGKSLSTQYHERKHETLHVVSGRGYMSINRDLKEIKTGDTIVIPPGTIHRMEAITDLVVIESSTTELDDIVRLSNGG